MIILGISFIRLVQRKTLVLIWSLESCWARFISEKVNHPGVPVLYGWESQVGVLFYIYSFLFCDRTWVEFMSISTWLAGFSAGTPGFSAGTPGFPPSPKLDSVKNICSLVTVLWDHAWPFDDSVRHLFICIRLALDWVKPVSSPVGIYGSERVKANKWFSHWLPLCCLTLKNQFIKFPL